MEYTFSSPDFNHNILCPGGDDLPGPIIQTHWPPPDGADSWQGIGQIADRVIARIVPTITDKAAYRNENDMNEQGNILDELKSLLLKHWREGKKEIVTYGAVREEYPAATLEEYSAAAEAAWTEMKKEDERDTERKNTPAEYFGVCPQCGKCDELLNIHKDHWCVCHKHKTKWVIGGNLFSCWRHENEGIWEANFRLLSTYHAVDPLNPPIIECPRCGVETFGIGLGTHSLLCRKSDGTETELSNDAVQVALRVLKENRVTICRDIPF